MLKMKQGLKSIIKKIVPSSVNFGLLTILSKPKAIKAKRIFEQAPETPIWLEWDVLEELQQKHSFPPVYGYDPQSFEKRGKQRARKILNLIRTETEKIRSFLELGCNDGMVSCVLQRMHACTTAIDIRSEGFDDRAVREGVTLLQMDATSQAFKDESFDFVFSYNAFEHFAKPKSVLEEAIRVVRTGGYIYLNFAPLYMSPYGLHVYRLITIPYCQFLFPKELLQQFANAKGLSAMPFPDVNGWTLEDFRKLWNQYSHILKRTMYYERLNVSHLDLIMKYPSCFKSKNKYFDNFIVSSIEVLFKKIR